MPDPSTQDKILNTAEKLFADNGFGATSLRGITTEADVNLAAVHYHFGSKEALILAVFERILGPVNRQRLEQLDRAQREQDPVPLETILRAFFEPPTRLWEGSRGQVLAKLFGRLFAEADGLLEPIIRTQFADVFARFFEALRKSLPDLSYEDLMWRFHFFIGAGVHTVSRKKMIDSFCGRNSLDGSEMLEQLVAFGAAGFRAPSRSVTREVS